MQAIIIDSLQIFFNQERIKRGLNYYKNNKLFDIKLEKNTIEAKVKGNINLFLNTFEENIYLIKICCPKISKEEKKNIIQLYLKYNSLENLIINQTSNEFNKKIQPIIKNIILQTKISCSCFDHKNCKHISALFFYMIENIFTNHKILKLFDFNLVDIIKNASYDLKYFLIEHYKKKCVTYSLKNFQSLDLNTLAIKVFTKNKNTTRLISLQKYCYKNE